MMATEEYLITNIRTKFQNALRGSKMSLRQEDVWTVGPIRYHVDLVLYKNNLPFAVFEIKRNFGEISVESVKPQLQTYLKVTGARFGIIFIEDDYYLYDTFDKDDRYKNVPFEELVLSLKEPTSITVKADDHTKIIELFRSAAKEFFFPDSWFYQYIYSETFGSQIIFDEKSHSFIFADSDKENDFFNAMFSPFREKQICRYTSLSAVFEMLNRLSFRMCGIMGMNDKSEINYTDVYMGNWNDQTAVFSKPLIKEHHSKIIALNNRYITSCSTLQRKDDLALWRMYAGDGKGVCLLFDVKSVPLDHRVLLQRVKYADKNNRHKELEFLKFITAQNLANGRFKFDFRLFNYWRHFFKPYDYNSEDEIRMLLVDNGNFAAVNQDWVMTYSHNIINPVIDFRLNSHNFPLQLRTIILGPKCDEQETNYVQLQELIRRKKKEIREKHIDSNLDKLKIELSRITHYR